MQNNTFHIPAEESNQHREQAEPADLQREIASGTHGPTTHERLGYLGLNEGLEQITRNDENREWPESSTENMRTLTSIGAEFEQIRESIRNDYDQAA